MVKTRNAVKEESSENENELEEMSVKELLKKIYKKMTSYDVIIIEMKELKEMVIENRKEIDTLKKKLDEKELENKILKKSVEVQDENIGELNQRSRMSNIVINGMKENQKENIKEIVENLGKEIGILNPEDHIQVAHRVPSKTSPKPIVVRLLNTKTRDIWVKAGKENKLFDKKIYINEHLTTKNYTLLRNTRAWAKTNHYKFVWTQDCRVLMRKDENSRIRSVKTMKDLSMDWKDVTRSSSSEEETTDA